MSIGQMLLIDGLDPYARREDDFYETFRWQTGALLRRCRWAPGWKIVEPCAGELAIAKMFRECGCDVWANDLVQRRQPLNSALDARDPDSWRYIAKQHGGIDVGVTNLPFSDAFAIVPVALEHVRLGFITLLRSTWDEPTEERCEWLAQHDHLIEQIAMPRANYRGTSNNDSATHHWFIFAKDSVLVPRPIPPGWRTVTWRERDELKRLYGEGAH